MKIENLPAVLNEREVVVLVLRLKNKSLSEIAKQLKVTKERIRQIERKALKKELSNLEKIEKKSHLQTINKSHKRTP